MKRFCLLLISLIAIVSVGFAQRDDEGKRSKMFKEIREFKMKFLAQEMDLTEQQKTKFYELYSQMTQERDECYKSVKEMEHKLKKDKDASEEDYQKLTEAMNKANLEYAEIEKKYDEKFSEFLSQKQIYKMKEGEKSFREKLEEMRHERKREHKKAK